MKFFKEQHGSAEFYRAVFEIENPYGRYAAFYGEDLQFFLLAHKGTLFMLNADYLVEGQSGDGTVHSSDEVIYSNTHVVKRGASYDIIEHHTKTRQDVYIDPEGGSDMKIEDSGGGEAAVYALEEVINAAEIKADKTGSLVALSIEPYRTISYGKTLIDKTSPFMYTIQNAFDGKITEFTNSYAAERRNIEADYTENLRQRFGELTVKHTEQTSRIAHEIEETQKSAQMQIEGIRRLVNSFTAEIKDKASGLIFYSDYQQVTGFDPYQITNDNLLKGNLKNDIPNVSSMQDVLDKFSNKTDA